MTNEEALKTLWNGCDRNPKTYQAYHVLAKQRTGHWTHDGSHWKNRFICSECGYKLFDEPTNYCPHCGAKMGGEQNE